MMTEIKNILISFRKNHPYIFCIVMVTIFEMTLCVDVPMDGLGRALHLDRSVIWAEQAVCNVVMIAIGILIIFLIGRKKILSNKGAGIGRTIVIAGFFIFYNFVVGIGMLANYQYAEKVYKVGDIAVFLLSMFLIGIGEELFYRGIIGSTLLEHFGMEQKGILYAVFIDALIFGLSHFINVLAGKPFLGVFTQVLDIIFSSALFVAIYFRSGNIWIVAILHGVMDAIINIGEIIVANPNEIVANASQQAGINVRSILFNMAIGIIPTLFLLRKSKISEVRKNMGPILENN